MGINIKYGSGKSIEVAPGLSLFEIAKNIGEGHERASYAATVNGVVRDMRDAVDDDAEIGY